MKASDIPYKFAEVWAKNATTSFITSPIPEFTSSGTVASQDLGFPPATATPVGAGGAPPIIGDFNGALQYTTTWDQWQQAGGPVFYDATFSGNIGGYPKGAVLTAAAFGEKMWLNTSENNTSDPDTGGAGWVSLLAGRLLKVTTFKSSGTYTPTAGANSAMIFGGGAGGGGAPAVAAGSGQATASSGGSAGSFGQRYIASGLTTTNVTIGSGGGSGANGGTTSFGSVCIFPGGLAGVQGSAVSGGAVTSSSPNFAADPTGVDSGSPGALGSPGLALSALSVLGGAGGNSPYGAGASSNGVNGTGSQAGNIGNGNCSGGGGAAGVNNGSTPAGGAGADGILIIWEYS